MRWIRLVVFTITILIGLKSTAQVDLCPLMGNKIDAGQFIVDYDNQNKVPKLVYYIIVDSKLGSYGRYSFHKQLYSFTANPSDYNYSGYDRGHMFPSASANDDTSNYHSFDMINILPQTASLNRGVWKSIEVFERNNCYPIGYVICGIILDGSETYINGVLVPNKLFKCIYNPSFNAMIGFIITQDSDDNLQKYISTVDQIEQLIGVDLFYQLDNFTQYMLESRVDKSIWNFVY